jgi:L-malate glycosyltransferase
MKALLLTPTFFPRLTGNAVTVRRIAQELEERGINCRVLDLSVVAEAEVVKAAREFRPDLLHSFHAFKSGYVGLAVKNLLKIPMITTLTGTDLHVDLKTPKTREALLCVLKQADRLTVFNDMARHHIVREGITPGKISVIHQSVSFPERKERNFRTELNIGSKTTVFLMIGGIRRIKNIGYAFPVLEQIREHFADFCFLIAGPVLDETEFLRLNRKRLERPWIRFIGEIPREEIPSLLMCADIVLNTSNSESEANAVMEALAFGKAVIGRRISGNASLLTEETGYPFCNRRELYEQIFRILRNKKEAKQIGRRAKRFIAARFHRNREQEDYLRLYSETAGLGRGPIVAVS